MSVSKFQNIAIQNQMDANSTGEAIQAFRISCNICVTRGMNYIECSQCPIKACHEQTLAVFADLREYDLMKSANRSTTVEPLHAVKRPS